MSPAEFIDNPAFADFLPENRESVRARPALTHEDCSPLDVEAVARHLKRGGTLGSMAGYEERPGQIDMTGAVAQAFNAREHLMVEAGTGVGKSLAYLIPSILWAATNDTTVVVSTATRNLQSQLVRNDIPRALAVLGDRAKDFKFALLKGRSNYLCLRAVAEFFSAGYWTMEESDQKLMPAFIDWLTTTPDGDLDTYDGLSRSLISCTGDECSGRRCPFYSRCFVYRARKNAFDAHLVVANHALVLAEATSNGGGILPPFSRLVLDEAHNLEQIATDYLSFEFSTAALGRILNRLMRKGRGRRMRAGGTLAALERQLQKGALSRNPCVTGIAHELGLISAAIAKTSTACESLASVAGRLLRPARDRGICRYRVRAVREYSLHGLFKPYEAGAWDEARLVNQQADFEAALADLVNRLHALRDTLESCTDPNEVNPVGDLAVQLNASADALVEFANETNFVLKADKDTHAYWIERVRGERKSGSVRLMAAPLSVAAALHKLLFETKDTVVLSSATLRVGNDFRYMAKRLGFARAENETEDRFRSLTAESPFNYLMQSLVLAPDCLPDPSSDPVGYAKSLAGVMSDLFAATRGRALVLFTSYEMMNAVACEAREPLAASGIELFVQGEGMSRESMTAALREAGGASVVLFGAQSFWEGVDVAGEALSCVVLARLPFLQVADPIVEARAEKIDREGGSSFRDYSLPEAIIRFRQGFGRLIRTRADRGVVIVTDPRLVTKNYGASFRRSIPASVHTVFDLSDLTSRVGEFMIAE